MVGNISTWGVLFVPPNYIVQQWICVGTMNSLASSWMFYKVEYQSQIPRNVSYIWTLGNRKVYPVTLLAECISYKATSTLTTFACLPYLSFLDRGENWVWLGAIYYPYIFSKLLDIFWCTPSMNQHAATKPSLPEGLLRDVQAVEVWLKLPWL